MEDGPLPGHFVRSTAGRDSGKTYLVLGALDSRYVLVADGNARRVEDRKRKNVRHLEVLDMAPGAIRTKIGSGQRVSNEEVMEALSWIRKAAQKIELEGSTSECQEV